MQNQHTDTESLNQEYYQINQDIRNSFSKFRPPLNIYRFHEEVARIEPYYMVGGRLSKDQVEELESLVDEGNIFVSRSDHSVYIKHISHQLDLVLVDKNLTPTEVADIFKTALTMRMEEFLEQPVKALYERLHEDIMVLTEYLAADVYRVKALVKRLHAKHTLANHCVNSGLLGLALYLMLHSEDFAKNVVPRKSLDQMAVALFLHDMGMAKVPAFIRDKTTPLNVDEQQKIMQHVKAGYEMLVKLGVRFTEIERAVLEHHERLNGTGYPGRTKEDNLSYAGKLCALTDSLAAMITDRPYAKAMEPKEAAQALLKDEQRYDARLSKALMSLLMTDKLIIGTDKAAD